MVPGRRRWQSGQGASFASEGCLSGRQGGSFLESR